MIDYIEAEKRDSSQHLAWLTQKNTSANPQKPAKTKIIFKKAKKGVATQLMVVYILNMVSTRPKQRDNKTKDISRKVQCR